MWYCHCFWKTYKKNVKYNVRLQIAKKHSRFLKITQLLKEVTYTDPNKYESRHTNRACHEPNGADVMEYSMSGIYAKNV